MEIPIHILNGQIEDVAMETPNPSMEGEFASMLQMERAQNFTPPPTPLQTAQRVLINPQITMFEPFDKFHCPRD
jgi:hypothetical protein